jgi:hypothetical protein
MAERFKAADCKSVEFSHRRFESCFLHFAKVSPKYNAAGSVPALGAGSHVFKSHYFDFFKFVIRNLKTNILLSS